MAGGRRVPAARLLVAALWAGSLWALGYIAAPAAFKVLGSGLAGDLVAVLLTHQAWLSIGCAACWCWCCVRSTDLARAAPAFLGWLVLAMLACALVIFVGLQPVMAQLRELAGAGRGACIAVLDAVRRHARRVAGVPPDPERAGGRGCW